MLRKWDDQIQAAVQALKALNEDETVNGRQTCNVYVAFYFFFFFFKCPQLIFSSTLSFHVASWLATIQKKVK